MGVVEEWCHGPVVPKHPSTSLRQGTGFPPVVLSKKPSAAIRAALSGLLKMFAGTAPCHRISTLSSLLVLALTTFKVICALHGRLSVVMERSEEEDASYAGWERPE
jgi:hypothetical protein